MTVSDTAVSVCFVVSIDTHDLGSFTSCEGLGCEVVLETWRAHGSLLSRPLPPSQHPTGSNTTLHLRHAQ